jgi:diaminopimelate decarboxylase
MHIAGKVFNKLGIIPEYVDIGGGFGIPYSDNEKEIDLDETAKFITEKFIDASKKFGFGQPVLRLEPGRYITGNAGILVTKVTGKKSSYHNYLGVDAGMNSLLRPALYGATHRVETPFVEKKAVKKVDICGRICENSDIFSRNTLLPELDDDDVVIFKDAGAYGFVMSSIYNGRPQPAEIAIRNDNIIFIRKRMSPEEMIVQHF